MMQTALVGDMATPSVRALRWIGALGAVLALTILAASILLRLTTVFGSDGVPLSVLSADTENAIRMVHRLAASSVGLLALAATLLYWVQRRVMPQAVKPVVWLVAATMLLAVIGPLTPGYRFNAVTVANVVAGTVLLASCWWLREALTVVRTSVAVAHPLLRVTFAVLFVHVGLGAAASAFEMHGTHWVAYVHSGSAMLTTLLIGSIVWDRRQHPQLATLVGLMACLLAVQVVLGLVALWIVGRPVGLGFAHAMLSPLLVAGLVSVWVRDSSVVRSVPP
jgi:heme A synthase